MSPIGKPTISVSYLKHFDFISKPNYFICHEVLNRRVEVLRRPVATVSCLEIHTAPNRAHTVRIDVTCFRVDVKERDSPAELLTTRSCFDQKYNIITELAKIGVP